MHNKQRGYEIKRGTPANYADDASLAEKLGRELSLVSISVAGCRDITEILTDILKRKDCMLTFVRSKCYQQLEWEGITV